MRYYENQLKRPFQRRVLSPGSPGDFYPKRALYSNQNQELVPAGSSTRGRLQIRQNLNDQEFAGRSNLQLQNVDSIDPSFDPENGDGMSFYLEDQDGQVMYDEDENEDEFNELYQIGNDGEMMFMEELDEQHEEHDTTNDLPVKNN